MTAPRIWVGVEGTLNRVGDRYHCQLRKSGHYLRSDDLAVFAELGAERIRYPCLWDEVCRDSSADFDWRWMDERMAQVKDHGLRPIAGFLHHGSGPRDTSLIDPRFPEKMRQYARAFGERYPWIRDFIPVNEILTTARFSCLYGHWYPHRKNDKDFIRALYNQCKASILAIRELRAINPEVQFIQTEDVGRAQGTALLQYQVNFENERRWLSFDLLLGLLRPGHLMYEFLSKELAEEEFKWMEENACPPDILGINHYPLSNRFLDHRLELYPAHFQGGNSWHRYADVGAVDTGQTEPPTPYEVLGDVWERFRRPFAVTEVHSRGHREGQMRWFREVWEAATQLSKEGADVRAVTAWSLLGSFDWNQLCTTDAGFYESGVFDLRTADGRPKKTLLTHMLKDLAGTGQFSHPLYSSERWPSGEREILFAPKEEVSSCPLFQSKRAPLLITGGRGTLSRSFARICALRGIPYVLLQRQSLDITRPQEVARLLEELKPWAVINAAGYVNVDLAEVESEKCYSSNVVGARILALECQKRAVHFLSFSSDLVFDGFQAEPYLESHKIGPLNVYGHTKAEAERHIMSIDPEALIVRSSAFFSPWDDFNFVTQSLRSLNQGKVVRAPHDTWISPTYTPDLVQSSLDLLLDGEHGLVHLVNDDRLTWFDFAQRAHKKSGFNKEQYLESCSLQQLNLQARRPLNSSLGSERFKLLPSLEEALHNYFRQLEVGL